MKFDFVILVSFVAVALSQPIQKRADAASSTTTTTGNLLSPLISGLSGAVGTAEQATGDLLNDVGNVAGDAETDVLDPVVEGATGAVSSIL